MDIEILQLGVYDFEENGLESSHEVGLFTDSGTPLMDAVIPSGESAQLVDGSRMVEVNSVVLEADATYYLLADNWSVDEYVFGNDSLFGIVEFADEIDWIDAVVGDSNDIDSTKSRIGGAPGLLGPNFIYRALTPVAGDYNGSGIVDAGDYDSWEGSFGQTGIGLAADGNGNQIVDAADYTVWRDAYEATLAVPVPEPAGISLLFAVTAGGFGVFRRADLIL